MNNIECYAFICAKHISIDNTKLFDNMATLLEQIKEQWREDCIIDDVDISYASIKSSKLHSKYLDFLLDFKQKLQVNKSRYKILRKIKFKYYRGELSRDELIEYGLEQYQGTKPLKNEVGELLDGDDDLVKLEDKIEYYTIGVQFLESIMKQIASRNFEIKNFIDYEKFKAGF